MSFGDYIVYGWMSLLAFGAVCNWWDNRNTPKKTRNIGYRAAHNRKKMNAATVACSTPVRRTGVEVQPVAADPTRADVISALRNLGWSAKQAAAGYDKATGVDFDERLKNSLALMKA